jgi:hypothetical protein
LVLVMLLALRSFAGAIELVKDGKSAYAIEIAPGATEVEKLAASELQKYLKQMSGVELTIQDAKSETDKAIVIFQARQSVHEVNGKAEPPVTLAPGDADMYDIEVKGEQIRLVGHGSRSVLYATYAFLDSLGCRFLAPQYEHYQGSAEFVPKRDAISFDGSERTEKPVLAYRKLYVEEGHSHDITNLKQLAEWMPKAGYNVLVVPTNYQGHDRVKWDNWRVDLTPELKKRGIIIEVGGHGYQNFLNADMEGGKLFQQHPDWFGQDKDGKRHSEKGWVLCTSNKDAVDYLTNNFIQYVKDRPEIEIFDFWPPDGAKWCECAECAKHGTPSDRQAILVHHVKEAVKSVRPDLRIEVLAYHTSIDPPEHATLDPDILLDFCPISQHFDKQINDPTDQTNANYAKSLQAWRAKFKGDISVYSYYRKYAWDSLPIVIPHYMQKDLQWYATVPTQGISVYSEPGDWFTYELNHYALAKLAWNPNVNIDAVIDDFCATRYGKDADAAKKLLMTLEDAVRTYGAVPNVPMKPAGDIEQALERVKSAAAPIEQALAQNKGDSVQNLVRLFLMAQYAEKDLEIQLARAKKAPPEQLKPMLQSLHDFLEKNKDAGVFLMRDQRLSLNSLSRRYGLGKGS